MSRHLPIHSTVLIVLLLSLIIGLTTNPVEATRAIANQPIFVDTADFTVYLLDFVRDDLTIRGRVYLPTDGREQFPTIIIAHGLGSNMVYAGELARYIVDKGVACYVFDFPGGSQGSTSDGSPLDMSVMTEKADLITILDGILQFDFVLPGQVYLMGESQGALVSSLVAAERVADLNGLILLYPTFTIPDQARRSYPDADEIPAKTIMFGTNLGRRYYADILDLYPYTIIGAFTKDVLMIYGDADKVVPREYFDRAEAVYPSIEKIVYPGAGHGFESIEWQAACAVAAAFVNRHLSPADR